MKPALMQIKEEEGYEAYFEAIRNTIAGIKLKWKTMPKVFTLLSFLQEMKNEFSKLSRKSSIAVAEDVVEANMVEETATSRKTKLFSLK